MSNENSGRQVWLDGLIKSLHGSVTLIKCPHHTFKLKFSGALKRISEFRSGGSQVKRVKRASGESTHIYTL